MPVDPSNVVLVALFFSEPLSKQFLDSLAVYSITVLGFYYGASAACHIWFQNYTVPFTLLLTSIACFCAAYLQTTRAVATTCLLHVALTINVACALVIFAVTCSESFQNCGTRNQISTIQLATDLLVTLWGFWGCFTILYRYSGSAVTAFQLFTTTRNVPQWPGERAEEEEDVVLLMP